MAKDKSKPGLPNRHVHARISFLHQASKYLSEQGKTEPQPVPRALKFNPGEFTRITKGAKAEPVEYDGTLEKKTASTPKDDTKPSPFNLPATGGLPIHLSSHLQQIARKSQIRLHSNTKRSICKSCNSTLVEGETSQKYIENLSLDGKKPHADVLVVECTVCGRKKRFPVGAKRQKRKGLRMKQEDVEMTEPTVVDQTTSTETTNGPT